MTKQTIEHLDAILKRLHTRLKRTVNKIDKVERQRKRLVLKVPQPERQAAAPAEPPAIKQDKRLTQTAGEKLVEQVADQLGIPAFLDRRPHAADEAAKAEILAAQQAQKKKKAAGRIATLKATQAGDRRRMPPQGKDALKAIFG